MKGVKEVSTRLEWEKELAAARDLGKAVVIDFGASWCGPCRMMAPVYDALAQKYWKSFVFLKTDADSSEIAAMAGIRSLPTFQIYRRGTKVAEKLGADPNLEQWLQEHDNAMPESFTGTGRTLGGGTSSSGASAPAPPQAATSGSQQGFDSNKPSTSLQFRLLDGSKLTGKFNLEAAVGEVYRYVQDMRPGSTASFQLMTTYPTKILSDHSITLRDADVANCVLTQKPA